MVNVSFKDSIVEGKFAKELVFKVVLNSGPPLSSAMHDCTDRKFSQSNK